ncbi:GNAT family N-acetyltransferase [Caballeronia sp. LZ043]|uniref:GNAT family N-acetyltransferase n=1 Tax=Caballeronia sp. LZ043 TaxID=3038569 RepID=UPI00285F7CDD|nr:GNAT family N-acetyltransferase [Caballeronia sp. LZ043]MDR5822114.1 GNAT family N-acetyltransferase [Caballeronia sp. LZ043]
MPVRLLTAADASSFQALRLAGLSECPASFASSHEEEADRSPTQVERMLTTNDDQGVFGCFEGARLIGIAGVKRETLRKLSHKAFVWGVYVAQDMRGKGVSRSLLREAIAFAQRTPGVTQLNLTVNADNAAAIRLYASLGFEQFGLERNAIFAEGCLHDEMLMQLLLDLQSR